MEYIVNGAIGVSIYNLKQGRNFLPFIADLKDRVVKYIDVVSDITDTSDVPIDATPDLLTLSLCKKDTNDYVYDEVSCANFDPLSKFGVRQLVGYKLDLEKSFITADSNSVGSNTFIVFYYQDEKPFSPIPCKKVSSSPVYFGTSTINYLQENRTLADKVFTGIFPPIAEMTDNGTITAQYEIQNMFLNLVKGSDMFVRNVPLVMFFRSYNMVNYLSFDGIQIDFTNSFVQVAPNAVPVCSGLGLVLNFEYQD